MVKMTKYFVINVNEFCFESHLINKLNGEHSSYCKFLKTLKNCESCLLEFGLYSQCKHFGKKIRRRRMKDGEDVLIGSGYSSSSNNLQSQYTNCGFCSDFYLKGSSSHSCYLKKVIQYLAMQGVVLLPLNHIMFFIMTLKIDLKIITNVKLNVPINLMIMED